MTTKVVTLDALVTGDLVRDAMNNPIGVALEPGVPGQSITVQISGNGVVGVASSSQAQSSWQSYTNAVKDAGAVVVSLMGVFDDLCYKAAQFATEFANMSSPFYATNIHHRAFLQTMYKEIQDLYGIPDCEEFTLHTWDDPKSRTTVFSLRLPMCIERRVEVSSLEEQQSDRVGTAVRTRNLLLAAAHECWKELVA